MALAFRTIILAYDDSAGSQTALSYACALDHSGTSLTVAHALDEGAVLVGATSATGFAAVDPSPILADLEDRAEAVLDAAVRACAERGVTAERVFLRDPPAAGIAELARARSADLIVVGTHGRHGPARAVLGSVAEQILRTSGIPVLIVNAHGREPRQIPPLRRVLVALDDSDPAAAAMQIAARLALDLGTHLTLCTVIDSRDVLAKAATYGYDSQPFERDLRSEGVRLLNDAANRANVRLAVDDMLAAEGDPAERIEHLAMQRGCDAIVIGSHGRRGLHRLMLGSVAESVARSSSLPVLVVPAPA